MCYYNPSEGYINVCGYDTRDEAHIWDIRQHVGMVFQNPDNQIVAAVVEEGCCLWPRKLKVFLVQKLENVSMQR